MTMARVSTGRNVSHLQDLDGVSTTGAGETEIFTGGMVSAAGYIDMGEQTGCTINVMISETGGLGGGTAKFYAAFKIDGTYPYALRSNLVMAASTSYQFTVNNCPQFIRFTMTRTAANMTVKFKVSGYKTGGNW